MIVEKDLIQHANGLMTAAESLANSLSLAIGGVLIELVGASLTLFYNTATYLVSATMIILIIIPSARAAPSSPQFVSPTNPTEIPLVTNDAGKSSLVSDVRDGMSYLSKNKAIMEMILSSTAFNFFFTLLSNFWVVYEVRFLLTTSGLVYGLLLSSFAIGQAIGALLSARLNALRYAGKALILTNAICGFSMLALIVSRNFFAATALLFVIGFGLGISIGVYFSVLQTVVPRELLGRVISADEVATYATVPLAQVVGAVLIGISGIVVDAEIAGIGLLLLALVTAMLKDFRRLKVV
jgi:MFS transporter, DHA3 family, macrolide efflux protein